MTRLAPTPGNGWTDDERTQIRRLEALCRSTAHWDLECSHTDAGDPWCIIYDQDQHVIVLHIARIDRRYVVVWPVRRRSVTTPTIYRAVEVALTELTPMT